MYYGVCSDKPSIDVEMLDFDYAKDNINNYLSEYTIATLKHKAKNRGCRYLHIYREVSRRRVLGKFVKTIDLGY